MTLSVEVKRMWVEQQLPGEAPTILIEVGHYGAMAIGMKKGVTAFASHIFGFSHPVRFDFVAAIRRAAVFRATLLDNERDLAGALGLQVLPIMMQTQEDDPLFVTPVE